MSSCKYTFDNIYECSITNKLHELPDEWSLEQTNIRNCITDKVLCICNHKIYANISIYRNIKTGICIYVGSECKKKLEHVRPSLIQEAYYYYLGYRSIPEYGLISDFEKYFKDVADHLFNKLFYNFKYGYNCDSFDIDILLSRQKRLNNIFK